jgi:hypothetical protein
MITTPQSSMAFGGGIAALAIFAIGKTVYDRLRPRYRRVEDSKKFLEYDWFVDLCIVRRISFNRDRPQRILPPTVATPLALENFLASVLRAAHELTNVAVGSFATGRSPLSRMRRPQ